MNVFDAIKGTILNVPKDISTGIKSLTSRDSVSDGSQSEQEFVEVGGINFDAGGALLSKFQNNWSDIHQSSEENAKLAKAVDSNVNDLFIYLERQNDAVNQFLLEISSLPELLADLRTVTSKIENLSGQFESLESDLVALEDVCEEQELQRNQKHHLYQLETYRRRRNTELEQDKVQMARDHAQKVQRYEYHLQRSLRDRQQAFEETFRDEVQHYKKYGTTSPLFQQRVPPDIEPEALESFVPEEDATDLNKFLAQDSDIVLPEENLPAVDSGTESEKEAEPVPPDDTNTGETPKELSERSTAETDDAPEPSEKTDTAAIHVESSVQNVTDNPANVQSVEKGVNSADNSDKT